MKEDNREIEVKFSIESEAEVIEQAIAAGAVCEQPVQFERNLRFDDNAGNLSQNQQVLRLRNNGGKSILTFKSNKNTTEGLADREEIETVIDDFDRMEMILDRLGYKIVFIYEKYRSIYSLNDTTIFFDTTPIGCFIEIEGPDEAAICKTAVKLGMDWDKRSGKGYKAVFSNWKQQNGYPGRDMVFSEIRAWETSK